MRLRIVLKGKCQEEVQRNDIKPYAYSNKGIHSTRIALGPVHYWLLQLQTMRFLTALKYGIQSEPLAPPKALGRTDHVATIEERDGIAVVISYKQYEQWHT